MPACRENEIAICLLSGLSVLRAEVVRAMCDSRPRSVFRSPVFDIPDLLQPVIVEEFCRIQGELDLRFENMEAYMERAMCGSELVITDEDHAQEAHAPCLSHDLGAIVDEELPRDDVNVKVDYAAPF